MKLLPEDTLRALGRLEFISKTPKEGFVTGRHKSPNKGFSVEFAEHRAYSHGDDMRNMDWRVLARTDRLYVKEFVEETNMRAAILIDSSGSMAYAGTEAAKRGGRPLSKFDYGRYLAAMLSYILINQQDAAGLVAFDSSVRSYIPAKARPSHLKVILEELASIRPGNDTGLGKVLDTLASEMPRRGLVVVISDFFDDLDGIVRALHHFRHRKHEVVLFHVMANEEIEFPFRSFGRFESLEKADDAVTLDPVSIRFAYLEQLKAFLDSLKRECGRLSIDYVPLNTARPYEAALAEWLRKRHASR